MKNETNLPPLSEQEKNAYLTLIQTCVHPYDRPALELFVNELKDYTDDEDYISTFNYVLEHLQKTGMSFITYFDWKQDVNDLATFIQLAAKRHYTIDIALPDPYSYGSEASISTENVFEDYDQCLRNHNLQLGFIDTDSDEYILFIHPTAAIDEVELAVNIIGYEYYEI